MLDKKLRLATLCVLGLVVANASAVAQEGHHWGYSGATGPEHWAEFNPVCGAGHAQSPVNIVHTELKDLPILDFSYHPSPLKVIDNGHTIQVNYAPGSTLTVGGKSYELQQFHFHHESETAIHGKHAPLELHLVHKDKDGNLAVVAVLLQEGEPNSTVTTVWTNLPQVKEKEMAPDHVEVDALKLIPANHRYYTFLGSLTTPPCSENVTWYVMVQSMTVSKAQIDKFAAIYPHDERPLQPLYGRVILESK